MTLTAPDARLGPGIGRGGFVRTLSDGSDDVAHVIREPRCQIARLEIMAAERTSTAVTP